MASSRFYRNIVMTGACALFLSGCSWIENWPPGGGNNNYGGYGGGAYEDFQPPRTQVMQSSDGSTWLQTQERPRYQEDGNVSQRGWAVPGQDTYENQRMMVKKIVEIEEEVERMRYSFKRLLPALYRLAGSQEDLRETLQEITPHAGPINMPNDARRPSVPPSAVPLTPVSRQQRQQPVRQQQQQQKTSMFPSLTPKAAPRSNQANPYEHLNNKLGQPHIRAMQNPASLEPSSGYDGGYGSGQVTSQVIAPQVNNKVSSYKPHVSGATAIRNIRFGEHADKTRIVLDTNREVSFNYDVDNNERILMLHIPGAKWDGAMQRQVEKSPLIASYSAMASNDGGTQVAIQLKRSAQVKWADIIPPASGQNHRLVIDLVQI